jgi:hypothetical protein
MRVWSLGHDETLNRPVITMLLWTQRILSSPLSSISLSRYPPPLGNAPSFCRRSFPVHSSVNTLHQGWRTYGTRVQNVTREDLLGTRHSLLSHFLINFSRPAHLSCEEYARRLYMNYRCYQIILRVKHFYTSRERCEVMTGYLSLWCRPGGDCANVTLDKTFYSLLLEHEVLAAPATYKFSSLSIAFLE